MPPNDSPTLSPTDGVPLLQACGIGRREPNRDNWLLRDVHLDIKRGSRIAVIGSTGSGKTLLLRALARLDAVDVGKILWHGQSVFGDAIPLFRRHAVYLQQRPALVEGTVEDNLRLPFTFRVHRDRQFSRETVALLLDRANRTEQFLERSAHDLSGGEAQIVALLRAIQLHPTLLLLDEPTAALDDESTRLIEGLVSGWLAESPSERAFVWVSHDKSQVARVAEQILTMSGGKLSVAKNRDSEPSR